MFIRIIPVSKRQGDVRKSSASQEVLDRLDEYLESHFQEPMRWLVRFWKDQAAVLAYHELREIAVGEQDPEPIFNNWYQDYSKLLQGRMTGMWKQTMQDAARLNPKFSQYGEDFSTSHTNVMRWITDRSAELVTAVTDEQKEAIRYILAETRVSGMGPAEVARYIRPTVGLTRPQAEANLKFYQNYKDKLREDHPRMKAEAVEKKAREAAAKYAGKQQRTRAETIARTEIAKAYHEGNDQYIRQAQEQGKMPRMKKVWATAQDGHVCSACQDLEGTEVGMDEEFSVEIGKVVRRTLSSKLPPLHPRCKCCVMYEEAVDENGKIIWDETEYEGIPKTWEDIKDENDKYDLSKVNPDHHDDNCANSVIAYEMRMRGKAVYAGPPIKKLKNNPELGWINPNIQTINAGEDALGIIQSFLYEIGDGARAQVNVKWNMKSPDSGAWATKKRKGHSFVAELRDGTIHYIDVQNNLVYNKTVFERCNQKEITYWKLNGLVPSDLGSTACRKE